MKRTLSFLLAALLLLVAVPGYAESETGSLRDGHYTANGADLYLYADGNGLFTEKNGAKVENSGVRWAADSMTVNDGAVPFTVSGGTLSFTFEGRSYRLTYIGYGKMPRLGGIGYAGRYEGPQNVTVVLSPNGHALIGSEGTYYAAAWGLLDAFGMEAKGWNAFLLWDSLFMDILLTPGGFDLYPNADAPESFARTSIHDEEITAIDSDRFALHLEAPGQGWTVTETDDGVVFSLEDSVAFHISSTPSTDAYAPEALDYLNAAFALTVYKAAYDIDSEDLSTDAADYTAAGRDGRILRTSAVKDGTTIHADVCTWTANGRLYRMWMLAKDYYWGAQDTWDALMLSFAPISLGGDKVLYVEQSFLKGTFSDHTGKPSDKLELQKYADDSCVVRFGDLTYPMIWTTTALVWEEGIFPYSISGTHLIVEWEDGGVLVFGPDETATAAAQTTAATESPTEEMLLGEWTMSYVMLDGKMYTAEALKDSLTFRLSVQSDNLVRITANGKTDLYAWTLADRTVQILAKSDDTLVIVFTADWDGTGLLLHMPERMDMYLLRAE